jgi:hypothetical protein
MAWNVELIAKRTIGGVLWDAYGDGDGHVVVRWQVALMSLDRDLHMRWQMGWLAAPALTASPAGLLFLDGTRIRRIDAAGTMATVAEVPALGAVEAPARVLAALDDGYVLGGVRQMLRVDASGGAVWPSTRMLASSPRSALCSERRILALTDSFAYGAWGNLGPALLLDAGDGALVAELRGSHGAAFGGGSFVLGLEGYDVFDTWLHGPDGALLRQWRSDGHHVVDPDGTVRVVECDRANPSRSRVVRLLPSGAIERGPPLRDGQASRPVTLEDGTILFVDGGALISVDRALGASTLTSLLHVAASDMWRFDARLVLEGDTLFVLIGERSAETPIVYQTHCWALRVGAAHPFVEP